MNSHSIGLLTLKNMQYKVFSSGAHAPAFLQVYTL